MKDIPMERLIIYLLIAGILPILFVFVNYRSSKGELDSLQSKLDNVTQNAFSKEKRQATNQAVQIKYSDSDKFFLEKHLESITFLKPELEMLEKVTENKNFSGDPNITRRVEFLKGPDNKLAFSESPVKSTPIFRETKLSTARPVEVDTDDIKQILTKIEGIKIGLYTPEPNSPQFIVVDFRLDKKDVSEGNQVFTLNMKLLKREYQ